MLVHLDSILVEFEGQGHNQRSRSHDINVKKNVCFSAIGARYDVANFA